MYFYVYNNMFTEQSFLCWAIGNNIITDFFDLDRVYLWDQIKLNRRMLCSEVSEFDRRWFVIFITFSIGNSDLFKFVTSYFKHMNRTYRMFSTLLRRKWETNYSTEIVKILYLIFFFLDMNFAKYIARNMETSNVLFSHHSFQILLLSVYTTRYSDSFKNQYNEFRIHPCR